MISSKDVSIKQLMLKTARYIGEECVRYLEELFKHSLSDIELEILEKAFTMGLYRDSAINEACSTALYEKIFDIYEFNKILSRINDVFGYPEES